MSLPFFLLDAHKGLRYFARVEVKVKSAAKRQLGCKLDDDLDPEFLIVGIDISEVDAELLRVPIRYGLNGEQIIWWDDVDPR